MGRTGVLLVNLGTPDNPGTAAVRKYLFQFLNDSRVMDIPPVARFFLVNFLIVPFRAKRSASLYKEIWSDEGSPLLIISQNMTAKVRESLGDDFIVELAMRYQSPSIESALARLKKENIERLVILTMYPHYASSSTGSSIAEALRIIGDWEVIPELHVLSDYYNHPGFINAFTEIGNKYDPGAWDHILFSYHGLPERQIRKASAEHHESYCRLGECCNSISEKNRYCYRAQCFETTLLLCKALNIPAEKATSAFQSRLGSDPWIKPYADEEVKRLATEGKKKLLVFSPAFVADCLETLHEIQVEYEEIFLEHGGEKLKLVESLNEHPLWIETVAGMIKSTISR